MSIYLGPPGSMQAVADPEQHLRVARQRKRSTHELLNGGRVVDYAVKTRRSWELRWEIMTQAEFSILAALHESVYGPFPYAFQDPNQTNLLYPNQSVAGDILGDTTGFALHGSATIARATTAPLQQGSGYVTVSFPSSGAAASHGINVGSAATSTVRFLGNSIPVVAGLDYTFQCMSYLHSGTAAGIKLQIRWYDSAGALLSTSSGTSGVPAATWQLRSVTGTAPASAAFALPQMVNNNILAAVFAVRLDQLMLQPSASVNTWEMGVGPAWVGAFDLDDEYPWLDWHGPVGVSLEEVG